MSIALEVRVREMGAKVMEQERLIHELRTRLEAMEEARQVQEAAMSQRKTLRLDRAQTQ